MSRRTPFNNGRIGPAGMVQPNPFGEPQLTIKIEVDGRGLMKVSVSKPIPSVQMIGLLLDAMQGQYGEMVKQASLLIDPNRKPITADEGLTNADREEKEDNHNS